MNHKIFVINLDKDVERLQKFSQQMNGMEWNWERFPALKYDSNSNLAIKFLKGNNFLSNGEKGCLMSHVSLWQRLSEDTSESRYLIFEDDARTYLSGKSLEKLIEDFYDHLEKNSFKEPEILYLGKALDKCHLYQKVKDNIYISQYPLCLHAYIINKEGARKLLSKAPFSEAIDMVPVSYIKSKEITAMVFHPSLFYQDVLENVSNLSDNRLALTSECLSNGHTTQEQTYYIISSIILLIMIMILLIFYLFKN